MSKVYFNELSASGQVQESHVAVVVKTLVSCLNWLKKRGVHTIGSDKSIGDYQVTQTRLMSQLFEDSSVMDDDQKCLLLSAFSASEDLRNVIEDHWIVEAKVDGVETVGLIVASDLINNGLALSLDDSGWDRSQYSLQVTALDENAEQISIATRARNAYNEESLAEHGDLFPVPLPMAPKSGKQLCRQLAEFYPNLIFADGALKSLKRINSADAISQIYERLNDLNDVAASLRGMPFAPSMFSTKATPESETREQLPELNVTFTDGVVRLCSWHLRYTPDAGRIHFSADNGDENTIYIGYIGQKINR